jgi:hypothetical protein
VKVKKMIKELLSMPQNADVGYAWDGGVRSRVKYIWLARNGEVVLSDGEVIYLESSRPKNAPKGERYWYPR